MGVKKSTVWTKALSGPSRYTPPSSACSKPTRTFGSCCRANFPSTVSSTAGLSLEAQPAALTFSVSRTFFISNIIFKLVWRGRAAREVGPAGAQQSSPRSKASEPLLHTHPQYPNLRRTLIPLRRNMLKRHLKPSRCPRNQGRRRKLHRILIHAILLKNPQVGAFLLRHLVHRAPERSLDAGSGNGFIAAVRNLALNVSNLAAHQILRPAQLDVGNLQARSVSVWRSGLGSMVAADEKESGARHQQHKRQPNGENAQAGIGAGSRFIFWCKKAHDDSSLILQGRAGFSISRARAPAPPELIVKPSLLPAHSQAINPNRRRRHRSPELQIAANLGNVKEHIFQIPAHSNLFHGISQLSARNPHPPSPTRVVASYKIGTVPQELGHIKPFRNPSNDLLWRLSPRLQEVIPRPNARRAGQSAGRIRRSLHLQLARGIRIEKIRFQDAILDHHGAAGRNAFAVKRAGSESANNRTVVNHGHVVAGNSLA